MSEAVTDVIVSRSHEPEGLKAMLAWSAAAHVAVFVALTLAPQPDTTEAPRNVMMIELGAAGPQTSGMTAMGGRAVQEVTPPTPVKRAETAPAPAQPEMTLPSPRQKPRPETPPRQSTTQSTSRTASTGAKPAEGNTAANTNVPGQGFGLAGGGGTGDSLRLDVGNFCCPAYLELMKTVITRNWNANQGVVASTTMKFTILRTGAIQDTQVEIASGFQTLDDQAVRALGLARLPPLPAEYTNPSLTVHMRFDYRR